MSAIDSFIPDECAACGKGSNGLKKCSACNQVKYCNAICQKAHRSKHKFECRKRATELHDEALFRQPPPREDCPICFLPLPINTKSITYKACCGKSVCIGCIMGIVVASRNDLCPFCRTPQKSFEEEVKQLNKRMAVNDAEAFASLGDFYHHGYTGLQEDHQKAFDLWTRSAQLGSINGHNNLGISYNNGTGTPKDVKKAKHHWEIAAMGGHVRARYDLGIYESVVEGNTERTMKHFMIAAKAGHVDSLQNIQRGYSRGFVTKKEFEETLRAHKDSLDEMKSEQRDKAASDLGSLVP